MKAAISILLFATVVSTLAADQKSAKKQAPAKTPTTKAAVLTVPADAVEIAPYTFRSIDAQGRTWIYRQTPFGVSRTEDKPLSPEDSKKMQESKDRQIDSTSASENGDSIRFVRNSPFGRTEWQKKKTDLNDIEQAVWARELAKRASAESAAKD